MQVSVIIPVYNAASFLDISILSALGQKQTGEVLLIDDRSTDDSLEICKNWELKDSRVKVFVNKGRKGAGAARNVGLLHAKCEYIAFLDADDYYLDGRFDDAESQFIKDRYIDGIVESAIVKFENLKYSNVISGKFSKDEILGITSSYKKINVIDLFQDATPLIQACTIKSNILNKSNAFDESLKQTQDTDFLIHLIRNHNIFSGNREKPIVAYQFHENNTTKNYYESAYYRHLFYKKHLILCLKGHHPIQLVLYFFKRYLEYTYLLKYQKPLITKKISKLLFMPVFVYHLFTKSIKYNDNKNDINNY